MSPVLPIPEFTDLVTFKVLIDGISIEEQFEIMRIEVCHEINRIPAARLVITDGDPAEQDFPASSSGTFDPGKKIEIRAGYHSEEENLFTGVIISQHISTGRDRPSELTVDCRDDAFKMTLRKKNRLFENSTDSDLISSIIGEYGLAHEIEQTRNNIERLVQFQSSDWDFLNLRAEACNLLVLVRDGKVELKGSGSFTPTGLTLTYGSNIMHMEAGIDARTQLPAVSALSWKSEDQEILEANATEPAQGLAPGNLNGSDLAGSMSSEPMVMVHPGEAGAGELQNWAGSILSRSRISKVTGVIGCEGHAAFQPGKTVTLAGMGDHYNGEAVISGVTHRIGGGDWRTELTVGLDPETYARKYSGNLGLQPASGLVAPAYGLTIGIVTSLEDPVNSGRVRIRIPMVTAGEELWARHATLDAGNNRGTFFQPEIGDEVIVGFLHDDPASPVILGQLHSAANPPPAPSSDDNHEKGLVSRSGIKFWIDDDKKILSLSTPGGYLLKLDEDAGTIELKDGSGNVLTFKKDGITLNTDGNLTLKAGGDIEVKANNIEIKASANLKAEGNAGAEVSASGNTVIKGAMVQIN